MMPVSGDTSLAMIQSHILRARFAVALAITSSVSAANPTTRAGRPSVICETRARMSVFSANSNTGRPPAVFLIFLLLAEATRQSATAAAKTAACAGNAASTASAISRAVVTATTRTPSGAGTSAGPVINVTSAPRAAKARAIAVPCAPLERLAI